MANKRKKAMNPDVVAVPLKPYYSNCVRSESGPLLWISGQDQDLASQFCQGEVWTSHMQNIRAGRYVGGHQREL